MKRLLFLLVVLAFVAAPAIGQDGDCCPDFEACDDLLIEASEDINELHTDLQVCEETQDKINPMMIFGWYAELPKPLRIAIMTLVVGGLTIAADRLDIEEWRIE